MYRATFDIQTPSQVEDVSFFNGDGSTTCYMVMAIFVRQSLISHTCILKHCGNDKSFFIVYVIYTYVYRFLEQFPVLLLGFLVVVLTYWYGDMAFAMVQLLQWLMCKGFFKPSQLTITHRIHVWYIYLDLVYIFGQCWYIPYMDAIGYALS